MISFEELLSTLGYDHSPHYYSLEKLPPDDETAHIFRAARDLHVKGIYVFETSPRTEKGNLLPVRPAVYVAQATTLEQAREIHRNLWNLSHAPIIIVLLPYQLRIYTGFNYATSPSEEAGLLEEVHSEDTKYLEDLKSILNNFNVTAIDTGRVWDKYANELDLSNRVDERLLKNLKKLGEALHDEGLRDEVAHALIGKYIYLRYLWDREILTDIWLNQHNITTEEVFSLGATVNGLQRLIETLEARVNGKVFPLDFQKEEELENKHVALIASVFLGSEIIDQGAPEIVQQLHLDFRAYAFECIPIETLSTIYEQFIHSEAKERKKKGVVYTPEILADYLLSEVEWVTPLKPGMKIFDPACGSGVFLVLAYRRLIEKELRQRKLEKLPPEELRAILTESIYGVEREADACYVTELSLILTLLHYAEPHYLHNLQFRFPALHNQQIFQCDFFDMEGEKSEIPFWKLELRFDFIVGNPPWIKPDPKEDLFAETWLQDAGNQAERPVGDKRIAEAFSWLVIDLLSPDGVVGLVMPATSLFNLKSQKYRQAFFSKHEILRITNFANLRDILFDKRATLPAATIIYRQATNMHTEKPIIHHGPFCVNQITTNEKDKPWVITINENEIHPISHSEAKEGETSLWKFALWGNQFDKRAIERIRYAFPKTLREICDIRNWSLYQGAELRNSTKESSYDLEYVPELKGQKRFQSDAMRQSLYRFSTPETVLENIPDQMCYIRKRGGRAGLKLTNAPHIILSPVWMSYVVFSNTDFVIPPRTIGISSHKKDMDHLKTLALYLNSSLVAYYLFFHAQQWGLFRQARLISIAEVKDIPTPEFTKKQIQNLANLWDQLAKNEMQEIASFVTTIREEVQKKLSVDNSQHEESSPQFIDATQLTVSQQRKLKHSVNKLHRDLQTQIDKAVFEILSIPKDIQILVEDFIRIRLPLDKASAHKDVVAYPSKQDLLAYAHQLQMELDDFLRGDAHHKITITKSKTLIECAIEIIQTTESCPINESSIRTGNLSITKLLMELGENLQARLSQWVYVQRGLRLFDMPRIYIYKSPRLLDWTRTQAMLDAADIIGEMVSEGLKS